MAKKIKKQEPSFVDITSKIISYENGELDSDETIELFQYLIDSGLVFQLQGSYGRMAGDLVKQGLCHW